MAQVIESRFRYRIHSINAVGRHRGRIIEIEDADRRERFHGTAPSLSGSLGESQSRQMSGSVMIPWTAETCLDRIGRESLYEPDERDD